MTRQPPRRIGDAGRRTTECLRERTVFFLREPSFGQERAHAMIEFTTVAQARPRGNLAVKMPFDPAAEWGARERFDVAGAIDGCRVRGKLVARPDGHYLELGPAW